MSINCFHSHQNLSLQQNLSSVVEKRKINKINIKVFSSEELKAERVNVKPTSCFARLLSSTCIRFLRVVNSLVSADSCLIALLLLISPAGCL